MAKDDLFGGDFDEKPKGATANDSLFGADFPDDRAPAAAPNPGRDMAKIAKMILLGSPGRMMVDKDYRAEVVKEVGPLLEKLGITMPEPFTEKPIIPELMKSIGRGMTMPGRAVQGGYRATPEEPGLWSEADQFRQNQLNDLAASDAGAMTGIIGTGGIPNVLRSGASSIPMLNAGTSAETAALARTAIEKYGYPVRPGQMSENHMIRRLDTLLEKLPFSGYRRSGDAQQEAINRGVAAEIGEDATRINSGVWSRARSRLQNTYENLFSSERAQLDPTFVGNVTRILEQAERLGTREEHRSLQNAVRSVLRKVDTETGEISGRAYQNLRNDKSDLKRLGQSSSNAALYAREIRSELDAMFRRSIPEEKRSVLAQADRQYAIMKELRPLVPKAEEHGGNISPQLLAGAIRKGDAGLERAAFGNDGNLGELARIGQAFKPMASSGTGENNLIGQFLQNPLSLGFGAIGGGGGLGLGGVLAGLPAMLGGAAAGAATTRGLGGFMASPSRAENMILRALGERRGNVGQELPNVGAVPFLAAPEADPRRLYMDMSQ